MATTVGNESDLITLLADLIVLEHDAADAYGVALERLDDLPAQEHLRRFQADHYRHIEELGAVLREFGAVPPSGGDLKRLLTMGKVVVGGVRGDRGILAAMQSNEDDTNTAYERALIHAYLPEPVRELLERNLADERRHRAWIAARLQHA